MTTKYKIVKEWYEPLQRWHWEVYHLDSLCGYEFWHKLVELVSNTKNDAEIALREYVERQSKIAQAKAEKPEEYFLEL